MSTDQITAKFSILTSDQVQQFIENYAERMVNDMDTKCLMQFVYDTIVENLSIQSPNDILEQISCCYDDETIEELLESVTENDLAS
jgi:hypothetical protein